MSVGLAIELKHGELCIGQLTDIEDLVGSEKGQADFCALLGVVRDIDTESQSAGNDRVPGAAKEIE